MNTQHFDVLVIGAGLSGIGMGCHLSEKLPNKSYAILERRQDIGGTWDLFKYPGIRSDSDMFTFGFKFRPWMEPKVLADGPSIKAYMKETAAEYGVMDKIQFGVTITKASWDSESSTWTLTAHDEQTQAPLAFSCNFLVPCTGYYNYDTGFMPNFPGADQFKGQLFHPQHWPEDLDYTDKNVVVIGSGATAVTVVPAMTDKAKHVTMLQRSPTYIASVPAKDPTAIWLKKVLPERWAFNFIRWRNIRIQLGLFYGSKRFPNFFRKFFLAGVKRQVEPEQMKHFTPSYKPWDERLCAVPNGDLFKRLKEGKCSVVTDHIETFTETGIKLKSGQELEADIVVSATGLDLRLLGGIDVEVDGHVRQQNKVLTYKAVLVQDAPNFAAIFGYTNAPWTMKADLASSYICRLLAHMDNKGYQSVVPRDLEGNALEDQSALDGLNSGYVLRGAPKLPRQGKKDPWRVLNHYKKDQKMLLKDPIEDGILVFDNPQIPAEMLEKLAAEAA